MAQGSQRPPAHLLLLPVGFSCVVNHTACLCRSRLPWARVSLSRSVLAESRSLVECPLPQLWRSGRWCLGERCTVFCIDSSPERKRLPRLTHCLQRGCSCPEPFPVCSSGCRGFCRGPEAASFCPPRRDGESPVCRVLRPPAGDTAMKKAGMRVPALENLRLEWVSGCGSFRRL